MVWLDVPFAQKDLVKGLGARWNPDKRRWFVPDGVDTTPFAEWLPTPAPGPTVEVPILGLAEDCWKCGKETMAVVGVYHDDTLLPYDAPLGEALAALPDVVARLEELGVGPIKRRWSQTAGSSYWSNGCRHCDVLLGTDPLYRHLAEVARTDVTWRDLVLMTAPVPVATIRALTG